MKLRLNEGFVKNSNYQQDLLCAILNCSNNDLNVIQYCQYDYYTIINDCYQNVEENDEENKLSLNGLIKSIFNLGIAEIEQYIDSRIAEIEFNEDDQIEYNSLIKLNPDEDIEKDINFSASGIYFINNQEIYGEYLSDVLTNVEDKMGFEFIDFWL